MNTYTYGTILFGFVAPDGVAGLDLDFAGDVLSGYWTPLSPRSSGTNGRWTFGYDAFGQLATLTAPQISTTDAGLTRPVTSYTSLEAAVLQSVAVGTSTNPRPVLLSTSVRTSVTDPRGNTTRYAPDRFGQPTRIEEPQGRTTLITYNDQGQVTSERTPSGAEVDRYWTGAKLDSTYDRARNRKVHFNYGPYLQVANVWGDVPSQNLYLNSRGLPDSSRVSLGKMTRYTWTSDGHLASVTDPEGNRISIGYGGNLWLNRDSVTAPGQRTTHFGYDAYGRTNMVRDPLGHQTWRYADVMNRDSVVVDPLNHSVTYRYTGGLLTSVTDAKGQVYRFERNPLGWDTVRVDPNGYRDRYRYDRSGNLTTQVRRGGGTITFTYDALNQLVTRTADGQTTYYSYDSLGAWQSARNSVSTDSVFFDLIGRDTLEVAVQGGRKFAFELFANKVDQDTGWRGAWPPLSSPARTPGVASYDYGSSGELSGVTGENTVSTRIAYNADLLPDTIRMPSRYGSDAPDLLTSYGYTSLKQIASSGYSYGTVDAATGESLSYDKLGRIDEWRPSDPDTLREYGYDAAGRFVSESQYVVPNVTPHDCTFDPDYGMVCPSSSPSLVWSHSYSYDAVGNTSDYGSTVGTGNRLTQYKGYTLAYDHDGNLTSKSGNGLSQSFTWNSLGQLTSVTTNGVVVSFAYDAWGRRIKKTTPSGTVWSVYKGDQLIDQVDNSGNLLATYIYYAGSNQPHDLATPDNRAYYFLTDRRGSVVGLVNDSTGALVNHYRYSSWGELESGSYEQMPQVLGFAGQQHDVETGLDYFGARYYDPSLHRFISEDPIGLSGGINPYVYAGNDPLNYGDSSGLKADPIQLPGLVVTGIASDWSFVFSELQDLLRSSSTAASGLPSNFGGIHGGGRGGASVGPAPAPARHSFMVEHQACLAAALDATIATASDLSFFFGAGEVVMGAKAGSKLASLGEEFLVERLFKPRTFTSAGIATASGRLSTTVLWGQFAGGVEGKGYGLGSFLKGIMPGYNMVLQISNAIDTCKGESW